jgi:hypothetical protein
MMPPTRENLAPGDRSGSLAMRISCRISWHAQIIILHLIWRHYRITGIPILPLPRENFPPGA